MALVITDNSPSAGYVAWAGMVITYKSVNHNINNGNSNKKYIWWDLDNPTDLQTSDTMPTMTDDDCIVIVNIGGTHYLWADRKIHYDVIVSGIVGAVMDFAGPVAPSGWLICNGDAISRTTYSELFAIISTTYGVGDGSTTFNIPNCKGKTIVGYNSAETEFDALGETGGAKTHTLITAEMPAHVHDYEGNGSGVIVDWAHSTPGTRYQPKSTGSTGGGGAHNNLQPYITMNKIIKY